MLSLPNHLARSVETATLAARARCFGKLSTMVFYGLSRTSYPERRQRPLGGQLLGLLFIEAHAGGNYFVA